MQIKGTLSTVVAKVTSLPERGKTPATVALDLDLGVSRARAEELFGSDVAEALFASMREDSDDDGRPRVSHVLGKGKIRKGFQLHDVTVHERSHQVMPEFVTFEPVTGHELVVVRLRVGLPTNAIGSDEAFVLLRSPGCELEIEFAPVGPGHPEQLELEEAVERFKRVASVEAVVSGEVIGIPELAEADVPY